MHPIWRGTTHLYLTAVVTGTLIGSARDILTTASLAGVLVLQAAIRRDLDVRTPVASTASHLRLVRLGLPNPESHRRPTPAGRFPRGGG